MNYPQLHLPKGIIENLNKTFPLPVKPTPPIEPFESSKIQSFFGFISAGILAVILFFIKLPIFGLILLAAALYSLFSNSEKRDYENRVKKYNSEVITFNNALKEYVHDINNVLPENYQSHKRNQSNQGILKSASKHKNNIDYKKGISHEYFKSYLVKRFQDSIIESASIDVQKYSSEYGMEINLYVTDFAYIDKYTNLKIDIEIDEPYSFENKKPIHLNDTQRNDFFIKNNWVVVRFAEEQVVNHPELCCDFLSSIINCFDCDIANSDYIDHPIPI